MMFTDHCWRNRWYWWTHSGVGADTRTMEEASKEFKGIQRISRDERHQDKRCDGQYQLHIREAFNKKKHFIIDIRQQRSGASFVHKKKT